MEFNTMTIKQLNTHKLKEALRELDLATKNTLSNITGLSVATCGNILHDLLDSHEVIEVELGASTGGRPSRQFKYNKDYSTIACIYFKLEANIESIHFTIHNLLGEVLETGERISGETGIHPDTVHLLINQLAKRYTNLKVISFGVPGVIRAGCLEICDIPALKDLYLKDLVPSKDYLLIGSNDVNAMIYGYYKNGDYSKSDALSYLYYPTKGCPGSAMLFAGKVIHGHSNFAGEVSYLPLDMTKGSITESVNVARTIACINCVINPKEVLLSGPVFDQELVTEIGQQLKKLSPNHHEPTLTYRKNHHEDYISGLLALALEQVGIGISFIED